MTYEGPLESSNSICPLNAAIFIELYLSKMTSSDKFWVIQNERLHVTI